MTSDVMAATISALATLPGRTHETSTRLREL